MTRPSRFALVSILASLAAGLGGCVPAASPLTPAWHGSIGTASCGVLSGGAELPRDAAGLRWLRGNDRHWGLSRFTEAIRRAAGKVSSERPGAALAVGDLSAPRGGPLMPHFSHRSGVDADLLFYVTTLDGAPVDSPGFVHFGADGLARDEDHGRWLRLDVEREWLLVRALVEDPEARVQWLFVSDVVHAMLLEWALASGDSIEAIRRADEVMLEPHPGGVHDDHLHVRTTCSALEMVTGCEPSGPRRDWLSYDVPSYGPPDDLDQDLAVALLQPMEGLASPSDVRNGARGRASARSLAKSTP